MNGTWSGGKIAVKHCDEKRINIIQESLKMKWFIVLEYKLCLTKTKPLQIFHSQGECECECEVEGEAERNREREWKRAGFGFTLTNQPITSTTPNEILIQGKSSFNGVVRSLKKKKKKKPVSFGISVHSSLEDFQPFKKETNWVSTQCMVHNMWYNLLLVFSNISISCTKHIVI